MGRPLLRERKGAPRRSPEETVRGAALVFLYFRLYLLLRYLASLQSSRYSYLDLSGIRPGDVQLWVYFGCADCPVPTVGISFGDR